MTQLAISKASLVITATCPSGQVLSFTRDLEIDESRPEAVEVRRELFDSLGLPEGTTYMCKLTMIAPLPENLADESQPARTDVPAIQPARADAPADGDRPITESVHPVSVENKSPHDSGRSDQSLKNIFRGSTGTRAFSTAAAVAIVIAAILVNISILKLFWSLNP